MKGTDIDVPRRRSAKSLILVAWLASMMAASSARADDPDFSPPLPPIAIQSEANEPAAEPQMAAGTPSEDPNERTVGLTIGEGDTLASMLDQAGVGAASQAAALTALADLFDPMDLRPGAAVRVVLHAQEPDISIRSLHVETGPAEDLTVYVAERDVERTPPPVTVDGTLIRQVTGEIGNGLRETLLTAEVPSALVEEALLALRNDPDIPAAPQPSARFRLVYQDTDDAENGDEELRYVEVDDGQKAHRVYRYRLDNTATAQGQPDTSAVAAINFVLPLKRAEVTSPFGWRIHPVFKDRRFHKGVDFRAPKGTPVAASAEGVVVEVGWRGNYGKMVRVRHGTNVETTYSHLSGFARGLQPGKKVKQGQVIGYVGRTGVATGHHLYYELLVNGKPVNPLDPPAVFSVHLDGQQMTALKGFLRTTASFN